MLDSDSQSPEDVTEWLRKLREEEERNGGGKPTATNWDAGKKAHPFGSGQTDRPVETTTPSISRPLKPVKTAIGDGLDNSG
jgi:hypothetical protein